jgi:hypothetical protein
VIPRVKSLAYWRNEGRREKERVVRLTWFDRRRSNRSWEKRKKRRGRGKENKGGGEQGCKKEIGKPFEQSVAS